MPFREPAAGEIASNRITTAIIIEVFVLIQPRYRLAVVGAAETPRRYQCKVRATHIMRRFGIRTLKTNQVFFDDPDHLVTVRIMGHHVGQIRIPFAFAKTCPRVLGRFQGNPAPRAPGRTTMSPTARSMQELPSRSWRHRLYLKPYPRIAELLPFTR